MTNGIHHITVISSNAQRTFDFYSKVLGLRLVKKTVNFDAPDVYHLYFGNEKGEPGTALTFFPFPNTGTGMRGVGQVTTISFAVPTDALGFWVERFVKFGVKHENISKKFGLPVIKFFDYDGLQMELVGSNENSGIKPWKSEDIAMEFGIRGFYGAELSVGDHEHSASLLTTVLGYKFIKQEQNCYLFENTSATHAKYLSLFAMPGWLEGRNAAGTVHHIAFTVNDEDSELQVRQKIQELGLNATEIIDRQYFKSVYFREPNGILFELATEGPGFNIDEPVEALGSELKLPPHYEKQRNLIEKSLPPLYTGLENDQETQIATEHDEEFVYYFREGEKKDEVLLLLHGTGGDEHDLVTLAETLYPQASIFSLRGNMKEDGLNRFFRRFEDGTFDLENLKEETDKLTNFLDKASKKHGFDQKNLIMLGYSNGANFGLSYIFENPSVIKKAALLHPMVPFEPKNIDLKGLSTLVTFGEHDEYSTHEQMNNLYAILKKANAEVRLFKHKGGHEIPREELLAIKEFLEK